MAGVGYDTTHKICSLLYNCLVNSILFQEFLAKSGIVKGSLQVVDAVVF